MKKIIIAFIIMLPMLLFTNCYDRDVIDTKGFNHFLPKVENLDYTRQGNVIRLTWLIPNNISTDFKRPLEVSIQLVENDIYKQKVIIGWENTVASISIDVSKKNHFIVKLLGHLIVESREPGRSDIAYSQGQIIEIQ